MIQLIEDELNDVIISLFDTFSHISVRADIAEHEEVGEGDGRRTSKPTKRALDLGWGVTDVASLF